ncbi:MAG: MFS transporter [Deltaproteobacteria bacterium]|nr:MFS transporter [Deltaproteobacteria bacterium]
MEQSQGKFFYGWVIVFAGLFLTLIMFGIVDSFGIMFKPISEQFDWNRGTISTASMINWICFGLGNLACGALSDRFGSRLLLIVGGVLFIIGTVLMSQIQSLTHLYFAFGVVMALGRSAAAVPLTALITKWFTRNQGLALAIAQSQNIGPAVFAPLTVYLLAQTDWRGVYLWLGLGSLLIFPLALLIRDYSDAETPQGPATGRAAGLASRMPTIHLTLAQAMKTRVFWTLNLMVLGCCICHSCILLHGFNHMTDMGLVGSTASKVAAVMAISALVGKIACGMLADRISGKWAMALFLGLQAVMVPPFIQVHEPSSFYLWAIAFGIGYGGPMPVYAMLFREHFGTRSIGAILGVFFMIAAIGMGSGGLMGGKLYDIFGSYSIPFLTSTGTGLISAFLALTLPSPKRPEQELAPAHVVLQAS